MLRSCLLGTLADPLSSFPWATEVLSAAHVHSSGGCVCQWPQRGGHWLWLLSALVGACQGRAFFCFFSANPGTADGWPGPKAQQGPYWIVQVIQSCCTGMEWLCTVISVNYEMLKKKVGKFYGQLKDCVKSIHPFPSNSSNAGQQGWILRSMYLHISIKGSHLSF